MVSSPAADTVQIRWPLPRSSQGPSSSRAARTCAMTLTCHESSQSASLASGPPPRTMPGVGAVQVDLAELGAGRADQRGHAVLAARVAGHRGRRRRRRRPPPPPRASMSLTTTRAPSAANRRASAAPMPLPPPVTTTPAPATDLTRCIRRGRLTSPASDGPVPVRGAEPDRRALGPLQVQVRRDAPR